MVRLKLRCLVFCMYTLTLDMLCEGAAYEYDYTNGDYVRDHDSDARNSMDVRSIMQHQCVPIPDYIPLCRNVGYANMSVPNLLGHDSVEEIKRQAAPWVPLYNVQCHPNTDLFLCALYAPVCLDRPIFPCRSLCEAVQESCEIRMNKYGFEWPEILRCDKFPEDDDLCIKQLNFTNTTGQGRTMSEAANVCPPCKRPLTYESLLDSYCWANFVIKVNIKKVVDDTNGERIIIVKESKTNVLKPKTTDDLKGELKDMKLVLKNGVNCDCDAATNPGRSALLMGSKIGDRFEITYISHWASKHSEFKKAIAAISEGHDCKQQIDQIAGQTDANNGGLSGPLPPTDDKPIVIGTPTDKTSSKKKDVDGKGKKKKRRKCKKGKDDKGKKCKKRGKGRKKGKKKNKNKKKKDKTDPMENIAGIGCIACKQPLVFDNLIDKYCEANFVVTTSVRKMQMDDNGDKRLITRKVKPNNLFKQDNMSKRELRKLHPVISGGSSCDCLSANPGKGSLFIMGKKQGGRNVVTFLSEQPKDSEFRRFLEVIKKGFNCNGNSENASSQA